MKYKSSMFAWTPVKNWKDWSFEIKVGPHPDTTGWSDDYEATDGACNSDRYDLDAAQLREQVIIDFLKMILIERMDPSRVHTEFLKIDEYRELAQQYPSVLSAKYFFRELESAGFDDGDLTPRRALLDDAYVESLPLKTDRYIVWDTQVTGFGVRISDKVKSFNFVTRVMGKQVRDTIGRFPEMSVSSARDIARSLYQKHREERLMLRMPSF